MDGIGSHCQLFGQEDSVVVCGVYGYRIVLTEWKLMRGSDSTQKEREREKKKVYDISFVSMFRREGRRFPPVDGTMAVLIEGEGE